MRKAMISLLATALIFSLAGCGSNNASSSRAPSSALPAFSAASSKASSQKRSDSLNSEIVNADLETAVDLAIKDAGVTKNSVEINDDAGTSVKDDKVVLIKVKAKDGLTTNLMKKGIWLDSGTILKDLQCRKDIGEITLFWSAKLTDAYGNNSEDTVMKINLKKETLDKINFKNFSFDNLPTIVDSYWQHAAFNKK